MFFRLEAYDRNQNFGQGDIVLDQPEFNMELPDKTGFKDIHGDTQVPKIDAATVENYLQQFDTSLGDAAKVLYKEQFLVYMRHQESEARHFVHARCKAEMKKSVTYLVDVSLTCDGDVHQCQCECAAGKFPYLVMSSLKKTMQLVTDH